MRRWLAASVVVGMAFAQDGRASAQRILGAGREAVELRWEPASGPVAFYDVTCTVDGVPEVLVGTTPEPRLTIARGASSWGETVEACVVQAFDADRNPGPPSEPSDASFQFLDNVDLDGDTVAGTSDFVRLGQLLRRGDKDLSDLWSIHLVFGHCVDPIGRRYVECPGGGSRAP